MNKKTNRLTSREKQFCIFYADSGNAVKSAEKSGYENPENVSAKLLFREDIISEISKILKIKTKVMNGLAKSGYQKIAFGNVSDAVRLMFAEDFSEINPDNLDLFNVAEIKKPKEGAMEIKFFDRIKALEKLENTDEGSENKLSGFYNALIGNNSALKKEDCFSAQENDE